MLADEFDGAVQAGRLDRSVHLEGEWLNSLMGFIKKALLTWRDDPCRPVETGEELMTAQLCRKLNGLAHQTPGWDFIQFTREDPDETDKRRTIDLLVAPCGCAIWIEGREYSEYRSLLLIECKRLPTPSGVDRDEREYLISRFKSTGGVQRFKAGHHGAAHSRAAMIGYVQDRDIEHWRAQLDAWVDGLVVEDVPHWSAQDKLSLIAHHTAERLASLQSSHSRGPGRDPIRIDHIWIEM